MRIIFCGSRNWINNDPIYKELRKLDPATTTIVHGGAAGADNIASYLAKELGFQVEAHLADWNKHGKAAGPIRNQEMIDSGVDKVVAFVQGESRGTRNTISLAKKKGIPVTVIED